MTYSKTPLGDKVINAFVGLLADPDPRVAHRAKNALAGLAGDDNALADVYVGEVVPDPAATEPQPPELPAVGTGAPAVGCIDEHGVYIGTVRDAEGAEPQR